MPVAATSFSPITVHFKEILITASLPWIRALRIFWISLHASYLLFHALLNE